MSPVCVEQRFQSTRTCAPASRSDFPCIPEIPILIVASVEKKQDCHLDLLDSVFNQLEPALLHVAAIFQAYLQFRSFCFGMNECETGG